MQVLLVSTYELGRQPFGLASPAAWLRTGGHEVTCFDLSRSVFDPAAVRKAELIGFYLPMHTATRLAVPVIERIRALNPSAHLCCYGLYAPLNEAYLRGLGVQTILGGEYEQGLVELARGTARPPTLISLERQQFMVPDRAGLPGLASYARLRQNGSRKRVGYTEASHGCKHLCRHCPIVPVYGGVFRIVQRDIVLEDIRRQVAAGAEHITFGDPDFFNGPGHGLAIVEALHAAHPNLTYDVTIKIEHLLNHRDLLRTLRDTGCLFVTSAVESVEDAVLHKLDKGHTRAGFLEAVAVMREAGLVLGPTFVPFTPWTTWAGYRALLRTIAELELIENVAPIQLAVRLLIPNGSRLLELPEILETVGPFAQTSLSFPWTHSDSSLDRLCTRIQDLIKDAEREKASRHEIFAKIWRLAHDESIPENFNLLPRAAIPYLDEPWYC